HLADGVIEGGADAVLAASIFHFGEFTVGEAKQLMAARGIPVRPLPSERRTAPGPVGSPAGPDAQAAGRGAVSWPPRPMPPTPARPETGSTRSGSIATAW